MDAADAIARACDDGAPRDRANRRRFPARSRSEGDAHGARERCTYYLEGLEGLE